MKTIADEIRIFLDETGARQAHLASLSGIPTSTICNLVKGNKKGVLESNEEILRSAMARIRQDVKWVYGKKCPSQRQREAGLQEVSPTGDWLVLIFVNKRH